MHKTRSTVTAGVPTRSAMTPAMAGAAAKAADVAGAAIPLHLATMAQARVEARVAVAGGVAAETTLPGEFRHDRAWPGRMKVRPGIFLWLRE